MSCDCCKCEVLRARFFLVCDIALLGGWWVWYTATCCSSTTVLTGNCSDVHHNRTHMHSIATCLNTELYTLPHQPGHTLNTELCTVPHQCGHILNTELCTVPHQSGHILPRNVKPLCSLQLFVKRVRCQQATYHDEWICVYASTSCKWSPCTPQILQ